MMTRLWRTILVPAAIFAFLFLAGEPPSQMQGSETPYNLLMTPEDAQRLVAAWNGALPYVPGEIIVKFRPGTGTTDQVRALSLMRAQPDRRREKWIGDALLIQSNADPESEMLAVTLSRQPEVEWAQPNYWRSLKTAPNDPSYSRQWNFDAIKMPQAWDINPGANASITVAIVDTGISTTSTSYPFVLWTGSRFELVPVPVGVNPDIAAARILSGRDFIFWAGPVIDMVGHGTHVAGTALQETNNSLALAGIAYGAQLLPLKACLGYWEIQIIQSAFGVPGFVDPSVSGGCTDAAGAQAVRYAADSGAQIINVSIGGTQPSPAYQDAIRYAVSRGAFVSISAGNEYEQGNPVEYPASYAASIDGAVAVGAVGRSSRRAFYSNTGSYLELVAPGGDSRDGGLTGQIYQATLFESDFDPFRIIRPRFDRYAEVARQGTSMAAPHVAGVAALLYSQGINRPAAIESALKQFAVDLGPAGRDNEYGAGLIDARASLRGQGLAR